MAIKMLIFDSIEELKAYESKQDEEVKEDKSIDLEEITPKEIEEGKPYIDLSQEKFSRNRKIWTTKEKRTLKRLLKESKANGLTCHKALYKISKEMNRTYTSLVGMKHELGIKYSKLKKPKKAEVTEPKQKYGSRWTNEEKITLHKYLKECKKQSLSFRNAMKNTSEKLGRSISSVIFTTSKMGIKYSEMKVHTPVIIATGDRKRYSQAEIDYLISETKPFCEQGRTIPHKLYKKISKRLDRDTKAIKSRIYMLKGQGLLPNVQSEKQREARRKNLQKGRPEKKKKDSGYMLKNRPQIEDDKMKNFGKVYKQGKLFSKILSEPQEEMLKRMIENDIKNKGLSKITFEKLSLLMNLDREEYETFLVDVTTNATKITRHFKISVVSLNKDSSGQFAIFS